MVRGETLVDWVALLGKEARAFSMRRSPERARNVLVLCSCVEAAVTGYLIKQKMENIIDDDESR